MAATSYKEIKDSLARLYAEDERPWLVGFSGGKDSTMLASLIFDAALSIPAGQRKKPVSILCTDTRVEIPAIVEMVEGTLSRMQRFSQQNDLNIEINLLRPPPEQSFWVNIIGRGYPPPNRTFRWCTQRLKIDPVNVLVNQRLGHWGEAILHLGARREESASRAQTMAGRVVAATFRKPGTHRRAGKNLATLESGKWVGGVPAPFDGTIERINPAVQNDPGLVNVAPYSDAWLVALRPDDAQAPVRSDDGSRGEVLGDRGGGHPARDREGR